MENFTIIVKQKLFCNLNIWVRNWDTTIPEVYVLYYLGNEIHQNQLLHIMNVLRSINKFCATNE